MRAPPSSPPPFFALIAGAPSTPATSNQLVNQLAGHYPTRGHREADWISNAQIIS